MIENAILIKHYYERDRHHNQVEHYVKLHAVLIVVILVILSTCVLFQIEKDTRVSTIYNADRNCTSSFSMLQFTHSFTLSVIMKNEHSVSLHKLSLAFINLWESPWGSAIFAGFIYLIISAYSGKLFSITNYAYYNYLADAFLHGQYWLRLLPPSTHDLVFYGGKYYLYWSPFPAFVLMPFVAIFGVKFNDVVFTIFIAMLNVGLIAQLLRAACQVEFLHLSKTQRSILVIFFALGTVHFFMAPFGKVWFTGQLIGFTCTILAYLSAFSLKGWKAWFFTGLSLSAAMLTRNHLVFTGIFPAMYLLFQEKPWRWWTVIRNGFLAILPLIAGLAIYLGYNQIRFGSPFDAGLAYHQMSSFFRADYDQYGAFNLHYIPINFFYQYIFYPFPITETSKMGGSLFLLSPIFFGVFFAFRKPRLHWAVFALIASILVTNIPIMMLMGTGWVQFGPRYTLDFTVPLLLLTALGIEKWKPSLSFILAIVSIIQYFIGICMWMIKGII